MSRAEETLTEEERQYLEGLAGDPRETFKDEVAKLLRIHDRFLLRVREAEQENRARSATIADLEDEMGQDATEYLELEKRHQAEALDMAARIRELEAGPEQARVLEIERFAALAILTHWDAEGQGGPREPPAWPAAVKALTELYSVYSMDHCQRCKQWAPMQRPSYTCAPGWGCCAANVTETDLK